MKVSAALCALTVLPPVASAFVESLDFRRHAVKELNLPVPSVVASPTAVSIHPGQDTNVLSDDEPLTLGKPIAFETPLFKGKILIRFKNALESDGDPEGHAQYFVGRQKRLMQSVVQGQFKRAAKMSEIYVGSALNHPLAKQPPRLVTKILEKAFRAVQPGAIVDITSRHPKVMALYSGSAQAVRRDAPCDDLPDMQAPDIDENLPHLPFGTPRQRMKHLSKPSEASNYEYDTQHVYTFHTYNEVLDFGDRKVQVPLLGAHDLVPIVGTQPFQLSAQSSEGETLYCFEIRH